IREEGPIELTDRTHQHLGGALLIRCRPQVPDAFSLVEPGAGDLGPEPDVANDVVLPRAVVHVVADLCLRRPLPRPVRLLLELEAVRERRNVAGGSRVGVVTPGAAQAVGLLEDGEGLDPGLLQLDGETEAREAGADAPDASLLIARARHLPL